VANGEKKFIFMPLASPPSFPTTISLDRIVGEWLRGRLCG